MKKTLLLAAMAVVSLGSYAQKTVNVETAGTLGTLLTETEQKELTQLTIKGQLNSADVKILRAMTKTKADRFKPGLVGFGVLEDLDLSEAVFVKDTKPYFSDDDNMEDYATSPNAIGGYMFFSSMTLKRFTPPAGTVSVGAGAFQDCVNLEYFGSNTIAVYGASAFGGCEKLEPLSLEPARAIGASAFQKNLKITDVVLSDDLKSFSGNAFTGCTALKNLKIGKGITQLDSYSFNGLPALETVELSENITEIYPNSFNNCTALKSFTCHAKVVPTTPNLSYATGPFEGVPATAVLYVPEESVDMYKVALHWKNFQHVEPIADSGTGVVDVINWNEGESRWFNLQGVEVSSPDNGLFIEMRGGKTRKVLIRK